MSGPLGPVVRRAGDEGFLSQMLQEVQEREARMKAALVALLNDAPWREYDNEQLADKIIETMKATK